MKTDMDIFNELSEQIEIRMNSCNQLTHVGDWSEHKTHSDYDLWLLLDGSLTIHIKGIKHSAKPGDVIFFYPDVPYHATSADWGCRFIYVHFDFALGNQQRILSDFQLSGIIDRELIHEEVERFSKTYSQSKQQSIIPGIRLGMKANLTAIVAKIMELHGTGQYTGRFLNGSMTNKLGRGLNLLRPVFKYIDDHLNQSIKMKELAALVGISEKYFISYFKNALGVTPGQYIYQVKMNRAREYLYEKKYSVQQIANFLGYPDPFTFSKAFKKYYNISPSKFV
ncbi:AraC family transcriptional regulator [Paenibacillus donghaensis]|uniref:AraC family transcriptional regulator n=1 Tax=Paenibacillus donghaensis TaxID=414771 RepID=A0A2Z2K8J5_9BACL|nr:AraC family transcriptional regulator [Paenibacillus donghaensis]ASA21597.1 AraC family transcriptional regulator [Paenibacillus donghaensis]